uniref:Acetyltransferase NSI isoform X3 n=1 Tax=Rhizophora mucronata TaxID=61149 RepID=A0A2P2MPD1_RHIMU
MPCTSVQRCANKRRSRKATIADIPAMVLVTIYYFDGYLYISFTKSEKVFLFFFFFSEITLPRYYQIVRNFTVETY